MKIDSSEPSEIPEDTLTCDTCGQRFDTVESLKEHKLSEVKDVELKEKGVD
jgi:transcriptional regulator NrdR family protein